jgi:radical SAM superfamily enzyme YgiQ (UPF0313 family)
MKILFINSIYEANILTNQIGTLNLATILNEESEYDAEIIDFNYLFSKGIIEKDKNTEILIRNMTQYILDKKPDVVGFSCLCNCYHVFVKLSHYIKFIDSKIKIIFGGPQASLTAKDSLEAFPWVDIIALGEGEKTIVNIIKALDNKALLKTTNGIAFRDKNEIVIRDITYIDNLNTLIYPDYSLLPYFENLDYIQMEVGRGCPFSCTYCSTKTFWKRKFRVKSVDRILEEVEILYTKFGKKHFNFVHDLFTFNKNIILEFCDKVIEKDLKIKWTCSARIDTLNKELIYKMAQCGCTEIFIGIETGSKRMQKIVNKNLDLDDIDENIQILKQSKIGVVFSFIYGFPEESQDDLRDTIFFIKKLGDLGFNKIQLHQCSILAGTEMYEKYKEQLVFKENFSDISSVTKINDYKDIITKYPHIFPQFYNLRNGSTIDQYKYLPEFTIYVINYLRNSMSSTYRLLLSYFNNDILNLYDSIDKFDEICMENFGLLTGKNELIYAKMICDFIKYNEFGSYTFNIRNMYSYEVDFIGFKVSSKNNDIQVKKYDIDVLKVEKENLPLDKIKYEPIDVMFKNIDNINIGIKKIVNSYRGTTT